MESGDVRGQKSCYDISRGGIIWQEKKKSGAISQGITVRSSSWHELFLQRRQAFTSFNFAYMLKECLNASLH